VRSREKKKKGEKARGAIPQSERAERKTTSSVDTKRMKEEEKE